VTVAQLCKRRYDMLKRQGRCVQCTDKLPDGWGPVRCPRHNEDQKISRERRRAANERQSSRVT